MSASTFSDDHPAGGFNPQLDIDVTVNALPAATLQSQLPPLQDAVACHGQPPLPTQPQVIVSQDALLAIDAHLASDTRVELGGVLLGNVYTHNEQLFVEVHEIIEARNDDNGPIHFTFTADVWAQINRDRNAHPELAVVGWYHSHPDLGVFYSADDHVVHQAAFNQPWHIGLVVDPVRRGACFFGWSNEQVRPLLGFYELYSAEINLDRDANESVIDWQFDASDRFGLSAMGGSGSYGDYAQPQQYAPQQAEWIAMAPAIAIVLSATSILISILTFLLVYFRT